MKVSKNGKVKLEKGEIRIGNFFFKDEEDHIKIQDLNSVFTHRVWKMMPIGMWLDNMIEAGKEGEVSLKTYVAAMWSLFSVAPDDEFIRGVLDVARDGLRRHPELYGAKVNSTDAEDSAAVKAVEEMQEFEDDVRRLAGEEEGAQG